MIFSIDLCSTKRNNFILKCFIQFTCTNLGACQNEGDNFFNLLQKEEVPRKGGFPQKRGRSSKPGRNYGYNCSKLQRYKENICNKKLSVEHTLYVQLKGYLELHNEVGSQKPSRTRILVSFELRTFQFCVLGATTLCHPHIKNKKNDI